MPSVLDQNMAKKKAGDEQPPKKNPTTTKIDAELLRQAKTVAAFRGIDLFEYLDTIIRAQVGADYRQVVREPKEGE